jgi:hypothetical protein
VLLKILIEQSLRGIGDVGRLEEADSPPSVALSRLVRTAGCSRCRRAPRAKTETCRSCAPPLGGLPVLHRRASKTICCKSAAGPVGVNCNHASPLKAASFHATFAVSFEARPAWTWANYWSRLSKVVASTTARVAESL